MIRNCLRSTWRKLPGPLLADVPSARWSLSKCGESSPEPKLSSHTAELFPKPTISHCFPKLSTGKYSLAARYALFTQNCGDRLQMGLRTSPPSCQRRITGKGYADMQAAGEPNGTAYTEGRETTLGWSPTARRSFYPVGSSAMGLPSLHFSP